MERGRKRSDASDNLPADKRPCNSPEFRTATSAPSLVYLQQTNNPSTSTSSMDMPTPPQNTTSTMDMPTPQLNTSTATMDTSMDPVYSSDESDSDNSEGSHESPPPSPRQAYNGRSDDSGHGNFKKILEALEKNEPAEVAVALFQLCEALSFCNEDSVGLVPVEKMVPLLVNIAGGEGQPDEMLLAVRAITYLCDAMPRSAESVVRHGALPVLCGKLLSIEYLDMAEQCLQALEKISKKQPVPCLQAGSINAVLAYLDFFSTSIQRTAVSAVANMCKRVSHDSSPIIMESLPQLCNLLQYSDSKFVETVATCLIRIVDSYNSSPQLLDELCQCSLVERTVHLISVDGRTLLNNATYMNMIGLLTKLASGSLVAVKSLLELNIGSTLKTIFMDFDLPQSAQYFHTDDLRFNQAYEVLKLVNQLIPPAVKDLADMQLILTKEKILTDQPTLLCQFSKDILPVFIKAVNSGSNLYVSYGCISVVSNIFYFSTPEMLVELLCDINISSFLANLLAKKDHHVVFSALRAVEILMQKLPDVFLSSFIKEGVVYAIDPLLMQETCQNSGNQAVDGGPSRCLCYTFDMPKPSQTRSCHLRGINKDENGSQSGSGTIFMLARQLKGKYFTHEAVSSEIGLSEISHKLKTCCQLLNDTIDTPSNEEYLSNVLDEVMRELCGGETMTTFEFVESGIVKSLANYLTNGKYLDKGMVYDSNSHDHYLSVLKRLKSFARLCFNKVCKGSDETIMTFLVRKLQSVLSSFDSFPVVLSHGYRHRPFRIEVPIRHNATHPCVKISFVRDDDEIELSEFDGGVLYVESTSSLAEIERYLWPKICKTHCAEGEGSKEASTAGTLDVSSTCSSEEVTSHERQESASSEDSYGEDQVDNTVINEHAEPNLVFKLKGKELSSSVTLYQSLLDDQTNLEPDVINGPKFWNDVHIVTYKRATNHQNGYIQQLENPILSSSSGNLTVQWHSVPFFSSLLKANFPCNLSKSSPSFDILFMLRTLEGVNRFSSSLLPEEKIYSFAEGRKIEQDSPKTSVSTVPQDEFISHKLTEKLEQQMRDPLALNPSGLPLWCKQLMETSPFLFSFEARKKYFRLTTFGRIIHTSSGDSDDTSPRSPSGRSREKFTVDRQNLFESASKMMESKARNKALLEVEYLEEVGTGLGPTIEFYTLISHEFQKVGLGLWRGDLCGSNENQGFVSAPLGLFPRPWSAAVENLHGVNFQDVHKKFVLLGQVVAKAIKDGRIVDITLSRAFYRAILEQELSIYDILSFDPELGRTLLEFQALVKKSEILRSSPVGNDASTSNLDYRGTKVEDLGLDFCLPGYVEYHLSDKNNSELVDIDNLKEYINMVVEATIRAGICRQLEAFKSGFNQVFPLSALKVFREDELDTMLCGESVSWSFAELVDNIKFDHGYTANSSPVINLLEIMQELESAQQKAFLQFVTGSPRLPPGGLASLNPRLTVVRKHSNTDTDMELPSVMTCANYLKLPPYSTKEKMRERLLYAITEGQGSFHLS
ncbi:E3 ubiquitin-protein ligase UPL4 [Rhynchospora pubera]|uniref:HECT-type E3 ubiquitin transferase n=1 Tax=Rhynchospora pubera TaxID=906938 RepID=A0AAV8DLB4_9POAL|nr:E3 ubiquitin-protein ligase UPL4 [Rhynchospora pubera]